MKLKILFLLITYFILSCQNESKNLQISWVKNIDKSTTDFDKTEELNDYTIGNDSLGLIRTVMYKTDKKGLYKIVDEVYHDKLMGYKIVFYIQNDQLIKAEFSGFSTYIQKGTKDDSKPCCEHFMEVIYFKSASEGLKFKKKLPVLAFEDLDKRLKEFENLRMEDEPFPNVEEEFKEFSSIVKNLKHKIDSQR